MHLNLHGSHANECDMKKEGRKEKEKEGRKERKENEQRKEEKEARQTGSKWVMRLCTVAWDRK